MGASKATCPGRITCVAQRLYGTWWPWCPRWHWAMRGDGTAVGHVKGQLGGEGIGPGG